VRLSTLAQGEQREDPARPGLEAHLITADRVVQVADRDDTVEGVP
jgi:hypothetical protein